MGDQSGKTWLLAVPANMPELNAKLVAIEASLRIAREMFTFTSI